MTTREMFSTKSISRQAARLAKKANTNNLETTLDSGVWPCDDPGAQSVKLRVPVSAPPPKPGVLVAEADLRPNEIQDLADVIGDIVSVAAGYDLTFHLRSCTWMEERYARLSSCTGIFLPVICS